MLSRESIAVIFSVLPRIEGEYIIAKQSRIWIKITDRIAVVHTTGMNAGVSVTVDDYPVSLDKEDERAFDKYIRKHRDDFKNRAKNAIEDDLVNVRLYHGKAIDIEEWAHA